MVFVVHSSIFLRICYAEHKTISDFFHCLKWVILGEKSTFSGRLSTYSGKRLSTKSGKNKATLYWKGSQDSQDSQSQNSQNEFRISVFMLTI